MTRMLHATVLTLFPDMFPGPLGHSLIGRALKEGLWSLDTLNIRDFAADRHKTVDDAPYGGGAGMVLRPDIIGAAMDHARAQSPNATSIYFTPRGEPMTQALIHEMLEKQSLILLCGRFEGVDERAIRHYNMREVSLGDFVLNGGEIAAMALLEACVRLLPGVIGKEESLKEESFANFREESGCLLEYPHYTRPPLWKGLPVPEVLLSGHHEAIERWRREQSEAITKEKRGDLWERHLLMQRMKNTK